MTMQLQTWTDLSWIMTTFTVIAFVSLFAVLALMMLTEHAQPRVARTSTRPAEMAMRNRHLHVW